MAPESVGAALCVIEAAVILTLLYEQNLSFIAALSRLHESPLHHHRLSISPGKHGHCAVVHDVEWHFSIAASMEVFNNSPGTCQGRLGSFKTAKATLIEDMRKKGQTYRPQAGASSQESDKQPSHAGAPFKKLNPSKPGQKRPAGVPCLPDSTGDIASCGFIMCCSMHAVCAPSNTNCVVQEYIKEFL